jgi:transcriptional regulator with XRE-family HTH domain
LRLSPTLKAIRRKRGLSVVELARRMGMARRTYSHFEAGKGTFRLDRVLAFAGATQSDPYALLFGLLRDTPALAVRVSDNKLVAAFAILMTEFDEDHADALSLIEAGAAFSAFSAAFRGLAEVLAARRDSAARSRLEGELAKIPCLPAPKGPDETS